MTVEKLIDNYEPIPCISKDDLMYHFERGNEKSLLNFSLYDTTLVYNKRYDDYDYRFSINFTMPVDCYNPKFVTTTILNILDPYLAYDEESDIHMWDYEIVGIDSIGKEIEGIVMIDVATCYSID